MWVRKQIRTLAFCGGWERRSGGTRKSSTVNIGGSKKHSILIEGMTWMLCCCNKNYPHLPPLPPPAINHDRSLTIEMSFTFQLMSTSHLLILIHYQLFSLGYFDGKRDEFEDMLERFLLISSTCFVKKALYSKELNHKRFRKMVASFFYV